MPPQSRKMSTGEVHRVELPSSIEQVAWRRSQAAPGAVVGLEIFTHFVGNGADLQIELTDGAGRKHGTFRERITGNAFWTPITVPAKADKALVATVKLPKHGLEKTSAALLLLPPIEVSNAKWSRTEARRDDVLTLTADVRGAYDGMPVEIAVFEHDADGAHDLATTFPAVVQGGRVEAEWAFEYHEDTDDIPAGEEAERGYQPPEYFFRVNVGGLEADSGLLRFQDWIEIRLVDDGRPVADERYTLTLPDGTQRKGTLDADGRATEQDVPPGPYRITFETVEDVFVADA